MMRDEKKPRGIMMKPLTEPNVLDALRLVKDPDLHRDIVELKFIKNLTIKGTDVSFTI